MKRGIKWGLIILAVAVLAGLWAWRYWTLNAWYLDAFSQSELEVYPTGTPVAFGENRTNSGANVDGYALRVDGFEIVDYSDFLADWTPPEGFETPIRPDKLALVRVTLFNEDSDAEGVMLIDLMIHGPDTYAGMNWDLLSALNGMPQGSYGITLSKGTEYELVLPFNLFKDHFHFWTWRGIIDYRWVLHLTGGPKELDITLNG